MSARRLTARIALAIACGALACGGEIDDGTDGGGDGGDVVRDGDGGTGDGTGDTGTDGGDGGGGDATDGTSPRELTGTLRDFRSEHLFALKQALQAYRHYRQMIQECDREIERHMNQFDSRIDPQGDPPPASRSQKRKPQRNEPQFDLRTHLYRILGTDLTQIDGISLTTAQVFFAEVGPDLSKFQDSDHFCSWLCLCPNNKITGGRVLSSRTRRGKNRLAHALRLAAQGLWNSHSQLGVYFRKMRARLGTPQAITATAHKLARIIYHLVKTSTAFDGSVFAQQEELHRKRLERKLRNQAKALGFQLVPRLQEA